MNIQIPETVLAKAEPMQAQERIEVLDVMRGIALLGILIVNMDLFNSPVAYMDKNLWTGFWDTTVSSFITFLVHGKFYTMYAFLFGLGFAIFYERAKARKAKPKLLFYRRLFILLLIGLAHAFLIWYEDILVTYALLGFLLPLFFNRKPKTLLIWVASIFTGLLFLTALSKMENEIVIDAVVDDSMRSEMEDRIASAFHAYGHGTFAEIMAQRASDTLYGYSTLFATTFMIFPLFLLGLYTGKRAIFQNIEANLTLIKQTWKWGFVIGLTLSIVKYMCKNLMAGDPNSFYSVFYHGARLLGNIGLCLFFMASIVLLHQNRKWQLKFKPLAYMGRMALSNYLFQSIVCTTIFYSYGLGLYGKVGTALGLVLSIVIFSVQIFISKYWFKHYQFGPVEWVWKSLTYGKFFRMKV